MKLSKFQFVLSLVSLLFLVFSVMSARADESTGKGSVIYGTVLDSETGEPLPGVTIMVVEGPTKTGTYTDVDGKYKLKNLQPGTYRVTYSMVGYQTINISDLQLKNGAAESVNKVLAPEAVQIEGIKVTAKRVTDTEAALLQIQKRAPSINDGISAEQIARSPDSDAASALKRLTGVTVVGGKYVYIRGMGERYSNTLLNDAPLPSPEPKKRVVPMDIIPANLLENVVTTKSFTPDQWGDFSGGSVRLKTKEFPENFILKFSASRGWNTKTTGKTIWRSPGGDSDWLGVDDGTRDIPDEIQKAFQNGWSGGGDWGEYSNAELAQMFRPVWDGNSRKAPQNQSYSFSIGNQVDLLKKPFGYIFSLTYSSKYELKNETRRFYAANMYQRSRWEIENSEYSVLWGGILNLNYKLHPFHKLRLNTTYTRNAEDKVRWMDGWYEEWLWLESSLNWIEQSLIHYRLGGEHELPAILSSRLEWNASYGKANRNEPDKCWLIWVDKTPENEDTSYVLEMQKTSKYRRWGETEDKNHSISLDWSTGFNQWKGLPAKLRVGWAMERMDREDLFLYLKIGMRADPRTWQGRPADKTLQDAGSVTVVDKHDNWFDKTITGTYMMIDLSVFERLRMVAGIRREGTDLELDYFKTGSGVNPDESKLVHVKENHVDWLPSVNLTYTLSDRMNLRAALSKTLTRPEYHELIEREEHEIFENLKTYGNDSLEHTLIDNYDLRWEFYPRIGELFAVSFFYKEFKRPIEHIFTMMGTPTLTPVNVKGADNYGIEFELRKNFDFIGGWASDFSVNANYALINSEVDIGDVGVSKFELTSKKRALIGQSPYVINFALGYENHGTSAQLLYNRFGGRIAYPGASGLPDITEKPFSKLDLTFEQKLLYNLGVKFNASNLLDSEAKFMQGDELWRKYKEGVSYSWSLSYAI